MNRTLISWVNNGWLRYHQTSREEIGNLLQIVDRDLEDAERDLSPDWRFGIAYNAALKLCTILLYSEGFRPERTLQHYRTIMAFPVILGKEKEADARYLDICRTKRNVAEYDRVGSITDTEARELIQFVLGFRGDVVAWLKEKHPDLL